MYTIRTYISGDGKQLERCIADLQDVERMLEANRIEGAKIAKQYLHELLDAHTKKAGQIFVAEDDDKIVGYISILIERKQDEYLTDLKEYAFISDLVILQEHRGKGLGTQLSRRAECYAIEQGIKVIRLEVLAKNTKARNFYQKEGFEEFDIILMKRVGGR